MTTTTTPRTDEFIGDLAGIHMTEGERAMCEFSRQLEIELNAANRTNAEHQDDFRLNDALAKLREKDAQILALREALEGMKHTDGCFCEAAFSMCDGSHPRHSAECEKACKALSAPAPAVVPLEDVEPLLGMLEQTASWHPQASDFDQQCAKALDEFRAKHPLSGNTPKPRPRNGQTNTTNTAMSDTNETPPAEETPVPAPVETETETQEIPPAETPAAE